MFASEKFAVMQKANPGKYNFYLIQVNYLTFAES